MRERERQWHQNESRFGCNLLTSANPLRRLSRWHSFSGFIHPSLLSSFTPLSDFPPFPARSAAESLSEGPGGIAVEKCTPFHHPDSLSAHRVRFHMPTLDVSHISAETFLSQRAPLFFFQRYFTSLPYFLSQSLSLSHTHTLPKKEW